MVFAYYIINVSSTFKDVSRPITSTRRFSFLFK